MGKAAPQWGTKDGVSADLAVLRRENMQGPGLLFVVSGPSGAGKDTVVEGLRKRMPHVRYSVSATTRPRRAEEREGEAYFFLDRAGFERKHELGDFLEIKEYNGNLYGTPRSFIESTLADGYDVILKPEVTGALSIKRAFPAAILVFLLPDRFSYLQQRLTERRTESAEEIVARLAIAHDELKAIRNFDYLVINAQAPPERRDDLPAAETLEAIIRAERVRIHHYKDDDIRDLIQS